MKVLMVFTTLVVVTYAQFARQGGSGSASPVYGPPEKDFEQGPQGPSGGPKQEDYTPQVFRHVFVHSAPDEEVDEQVRTIRVPGGDKHVNIIFVKTPSQSSQSQTEVILPEQDEQKNLVYVLLKKAEAENDIKIRRPKAKGPTKPEVYFIRYKGQDQEQGQGGYEQQPGGNNNGGYSQGAPRPSQNGGGRAPPPRGPPQSFDFDAPSAPAPPPPSRHNGNKGHSANGGGHSNGGSHSNGGGDGYSEAGRYSPAVAPGPIRSPNDVPSSGYGVPL